MDRLLTEDEMQKVYLKECRKINIKPTDTAMDVTRAYLEAQDAKTIKWIVDWLGEPCPHTGGLEEQQLYKSDCLKCWGGLWKSL